MLQIIHKNRRSVGLFFIIALVCLMMSGFGLDAYTRFSQPERYAVAVNETKLSFSDFEEERRNLQNQYRMMYGNEYWRYTTHLNQETADRLVMNALLDQEADRLGLRTGDEEKARELQTSLFPQGYDESTYRMFLQSVGMSHREFEAQFAHDLRRQQLLRILEDAALPSMVETRAAFIRYKTSYDVEVVDFAPASFISKVPAPADEELQRFYDSVASTFEIPARVSYSYVVIDPDSMRDAVEVLPEMIEQEYADNQSRYTIPEQVRARVIEISYPSNATSEEITKARTRADEALAQAQANEPFDKLVQRYSDNLETKSKNGDLGWVAKGVRSDGFDRAAFDLKGPGLTEIISTEHGFEIAKIEEYAPSRLEPLDEVRSEIEGAIRTREAPAYAGDRAHTLFERWSEQEMLLSDFAAKEQLVAHQTADLLGVSNDPAPTLGGLTKQILALPEEKRHFVELSDRWVIAEIKELKQAEIPPLATVRDRVLQQYTAEQAKGLARTAAEEFVGSLRTASERPFREVAKQKGLTVTSAAGVSPEKPAGSPALSFMNASKAKEFVFSVSHAPETTPSPIEWQGRWFVAQVTAIKTPPEKELEAGLESFSARARAAASQALVGSVTNRMKATATIDIQPSLLSDS